MGCVALAAAIAVAGCATRGGPVPYDVPNFGAPDRAYSDIPSQELIAPLDKLQISVFRVADISGDYEVSVGGRVSMPLIGEVVAVNRTPAELAQTLEQLYDAQYLRNPDVSVTITASVKSRVTIDGGVNTPGAFNVRGGTDLMTAVAMGGGLNDVANERRIAIFRQIEGETRVAAFDLKMIRAGEAENPAVYPGDIVFVDSVQGTPPYIAEILRGISTLALFARIL